MDLLAALRTTGAIREFRDEPVPDEVVARVLDSARFAPNGGNRQAWTVVVVQDPALRRALRDLYAHGWRRYLAHRAAGLSPFSPLADRGDEARAEAAAAEGPPPSLGRFAEGLDQVPVLLVVLAHLASLAAVDRDLDRYGFAGGASVYPFVWSILLAARAEGLGGVLTTMAVAAEPEVQALLGAPPDQAVAAVVALGYPHRTMRRLTRAPVEGFATIDHVDGPPLPGPA